MAVYVNTFFEDRVQQLFDLAELVDRVFSTAGLEYRIVGGLATYLYVEEMEPDAGRLTKDIDVAVRREDLERIALAAKPLGLELRHAAEADMLVQADKPLGRRAVHLIFAGEKVLPEYVEAAPAIASYRRMHGLRVIPLLDLVRMKLTSFRLKDQVHVQDLDRAGAINAEIEAELSPALRERLERVREGS